MKGDGGNERVVEMLRSSLERAKMRPLVSLLIIQLGSALLFVLSSENPISFIVAMTRCVSGFISILLIPGILLSTLALPVNVRNLGTTLLCGLLVQLFFVQGLFTLGLLYSFALKLSFWTSALSSIWVLGGLLILKSREKVQHITYSLGISHSKRLLQIVAVGFLIRALVFVIAGQAISPDASLYADYANGIMVGNFDSRVLNDVAVTTLTDGVDYLVHQGFTYVFAISMLFVPPFESDPTTILMVLGLILIIISFEFVNEVFGQKAALWIGGIVSIQPLFVFHSVVGYGPEIATLLLAVLLWWLLWSDNASNVSTAFLSGLILGLIDVIWFANYYFICIAMPFVAAFIWIRHRKEDLLFVLFLPICLLARIYFADILTYAALWVFVFLVLALMRRHGTKASVQGSLPFFAGLFITLELWRWPVQVATFMTETTGGGIGSNPLVSVALIPLSVELVISFALFFMFHLTLGTVLLMTYALAKRRIDIPAAAMIVFSLVGAAGTMKTFGAIPGSLQIQYLYSDSRFFLLIVIMLVFSLGSLFKDVENSVHSSGKSLLLLTKWKRIGVSGTLAVGFIISFMFLPSGIALVDAEERYGWGGLPEILEPLGNVDTVFLVDRAREFSWFTKRLSSVLQFSTRYLSNLNATAEIAMLGADPNAEYLILDDFTIARWRTLYAFLNHPLSVGKSLPANGTSLLDLGTANMTGPVESLELIAETYPNSFGRFSRVFQRARSSYSRVAMISILDPEWGASNGGAIDDQGGIAHLTIGSQQNYTNTWLPTGPSLGISLSGGFMLIEVEELSATVSRIGIRNDEGQLVEYAERLTDGVFWCILGEITIGDIRITIEGEPGSFVAVKSISAWSGE